MVHEGDPLGLLNPEGEIESCDIGISTSGGGPEVRPARLKAGGWRKLRGKFENGRMFLRLRRLLVMLVKYAKGL